ncbi:D-erythronate dehydrogenase [Rhizobium sp. TRM95796]|uniref:D-erythronate dehydrogenase n=1 Tax=Rhizobium sp. TRM95796 TaxID=2979862 RepID=UPI0021E912D9|nr:D-erythronate dehydrogenase [Rhizobium sp. TRM95796]MCV3767860.1 SDR family oxidoreductase [Rhizobium sp. TRM95796]
MHVMIIGAAGMIGRKLVDTLVADPRALGRDVSHLTLVDVVAASAPANLASTVTVANLAETGSAARLIATRPDMIFHLAAVVSGEAEADFEKGYAVNLDGTRNLFEAIRLEGAGEPYRPRLVFASSTAVFGSPFPDAIGDEFLTAPLTSYGTQKAIAELLLSDYSRRGVFDGVGLRLPTICIRPGATNKAASGFFSGILREPLNGEEAVLPVEEDVRHWFASPRAAVGFFLRAAQMDLTPVGPRRNLTMPGLSATVAEQIDALRRIAGDEAVRLIRRQPDPVIARIVAGWPMNFQADRARELGFRAETSFEDIIRIYIDDERGGRAP